MSTRLKYPEASRKAAYYQNVYRKLDRAQDAITRYINIARNASTTRLNSLYAEGDYYNSYITKRDYWIAIHYRQVNKFNSFLIYLSACKRKANSLESKWRSRIGIREVC